MMADVFACDVLIPEVYEAGSFGAAAIAMLHSVPSIIWLMCGNSSHHGAARNRILNSLAFTVIFPYYERIYNKVVEEFSLWQIISAVQVDE